ncbi:MAG TPA: SDR family NAD(P)-dependent oxidoreductase [Streptosporangiaceae bacterium]|jgi:acyl transferase domain-containing protein
MPGPLPPDEPAAHAVILSAPTQPQLAQYAARMRARLAAGGPGLDLAGVAYTLQAGRVPMRHRLAIVCADLPAAIAGLDAYLAGQPHPGLATATVKTGPAAEAQPATGLHPATELEAVPAWLAGGEVPWRDYWADRPGRVSLPGCPSVVSGPPPAQPEPAAEPEPPAHRGQDGLSAQAGAAAPGAAAGRAGGPQAEPAAVVAAQEYLTGVYAEISGIPAAEVSAHRPLTQLGFSSFLVTRLNARLERDLGETDRALLFAHTDLAGAAAELARRHPVRWTAAPAAAAQPAPPVLRTQAMRPAPPAGQAASLTSARPAAEPPDAAEAGQVAVIGIAGRYPKAADLDQFWQNLSQGRDCVGQMPAARVRPGWPAELMWGGFLDDVESFDPLLFSISPRDADLMDPQERLFLEVAWEALEDAGYPRARLASRQVAVFAGVMHNEYPYFGVEQSLTGDRQDSGATPGCVANRVSFFFDLHGPSMSVDTMCSSALTAIHLAVRSLRAGEAGMAIAGAVNLSLHPNKFVQQHRMRLNATSQRCQSFGAGGDGFVPAEGAGVLVLKPLAQAVADQDRIHAVIRGTSVVHAGRTNGYLVPNPDAQTSMVRRALADAGVGPETIGYLEAHGAGTELGDPVEIRGLLRAFDAAGLPPGAIPIGSVKSAIGHVESAAGMAGLTKVILQLRHATLVPSLHAAELNPNIDWPAVPFRLQRELAPWPAAATPRRAGVSSFGAGGTIAHLVVEEGPVPPSRPPPPGQPQLVVLSAYDEDRLAELAGRLARFLAAQPAAGQPAPDLDDLAYTLQAGREHLRERLALVADSVPAVCSALQSFLAGQLTGLARGRAPGSCPVPAQDTWQPGQSGPSGGPASAVELEALARHWARGGTVDWERLHDGARPPRVTKLPSYPFARTRCWLPAPAARPAPDDQDGADGEVPLYERTWVPSGEVPAAAGPAGWRRVVCVFSPHSEPVARAVAARAGGDRVVLVREGAQLGDDVAGYVTGTGAVTAVQDVLDLYPDIDGWLDLADLYRPGGERGLWQARLRMLQQVVGARASSGLRVIQVTSGLLPGPGAGGGQGVPGGSGALMAGFVRVLSTEGARITASVLDTDLPAAEPDELARQIIGEWPAADGHGEVCYRAGARHVPALAAVTAPHQPLRPDPAAAYLVTGGTRGLGALVARFLAGSGATRLALLGRRPLDAAGQGLVSELRQQGVQVLTHTGPLTDEPALAGFLARVRAELGPVGGVVHCAGRGSSGVGAFAARDLGQLGDVLEPKADGLDTLAGLTAADRPAFFVLFSSLCAAVPAVARGVIDYAAANACLDYAAARRAAAGEDWFRSVSWPQWTQTGGGAGRPNPGQPAGVGGLSDAAGLRVLERVLTLPGGTLVLPAPPAGPAAGDQPDPGTLLLARQVPAGASVPPLREVPAADSVPPPPGRPGRPPRWLLEIFASALRIPLAGLDPTATFNDLGVESIMLGDLLRAIEKQLGRPLEPAVMLDHPTLDRLSGYLGVAETQTAGGGSRDAPAAPAGTGIVAGAPPSAGAGRGPRDTDIAVIGLAGRLPGAPDADTFWASLVAGRCAVTEVPASRWDHRTWYRPVPEPGYSISKWGGFVSGIEDFDPEYFGLTEADGITLDPAIRMFLEVTASCLADAGYRAADLAGQDVGVFAGARMSDYGRRVGVGPGVLRSDQNFITAHVAQHFDFRGPNLVVDSACSSSLLSVQLAIRSLLAGESAVAVAGGVEVLLDEQPYLDLSAARALSPAGRCQTFDQDADGFVPAEGAGAVLLKPLPAALADGDRIYAVIEAVSVNNDGATMGITTPNPAAQADVIRKALSLAGRDPAAVTMLEAHGTGTLIGDPIELRALSNVFGSPGGRTGWCAIGSVKSNVGHLLSAAGIAGLLKVVLAIQYGQIPATLFCERPNPRFDFTRSPFFPNTSLRDWQREPGDRVAGLSSFGLGGTNAHLIVSGLDPALRAGHPAPRPKLAPPAFSRRRLWLPARGAEHPPGGDAPLASSLLELQLSAPGR